MMHSQVRRGDIVIFDFGSGIGSVQGGIRPAIVLQNDKQNLRSPTTIIAPLTSKTSKKRFMAAHVAVGTEFGLLYDSQILIEQLRTVNQDSLLGDPIGHVNDEQIIKAINHGLCMTLGIQLFPTNTCASNQEDTTTTFTDS